MEATLSFAEVLRIVEARTKIVGASSVLIGTGYAAWLTHRFSFPIFALMLAGTLCVDLGTAGFNSYFNFVRGVDTKDSDLDGYKVLVHRDVDPRIALWIAWGVFGLSGVFGLLLGARVGWEVVGVGVVCMAVAFFYSGGPYPIAATPAGEAFAGGFLGLVLVALSAYVQAGRVPAGAILVGLPSTAVIASILTVNNTCDIAGDAAAGRRTLSIVLGVRGGAAAGYALVAVTYVMAFALAAAGILPRISILPLAVAAAFAARACLQMHRRGYTHRTKGPSMGSISSIFLTYTAAVLLSLLADVARS